MLILVASSLCNMVLARATLRSTVKFRAMVWGMPLYAEQSVRLVCGRLTEPPVFFDRVDRIFEWSVGRNKGSVTLLLSQHVALFSVTVASKLTYPSKKYILA